MLSVIVPTLNEPGIGSLIDSIQRQSLKDLEIIIADGGSTDETSVVVQSHDVTLVQSEPGRGKQLNKGANSANGEYLLFLHADSEFTTEEQLENAMTAITSLEHTAGHFPIQFDSDDSIVLSSLSYFEYKTRLNRPGTFNGDQGLLIDAKTFRLLGGFSERYGFLEDQDFGERFIEYGQFITLPDALRTSARRFEQEGVQERILLNTIIMGMFHLRRDTFFARASGVYRTSAGGRLDPFPFLELAQQAIMNDGFWTGLARCYRIGRYANRNFWQAFLWAGLKLGEPEKWLQSYDRYARPVTWNPLGDILATITVVTWFFTTKLSLYWRGNAPGTR